MTLDEVLQFSSLPVLQRAIAERMHLYVPGPPERFSALVPWDELNHALTIGRFTGGRVRLVQSGHDLPVDRFTVESDSAFGPRLDGSAVTTHLRAGATLVINAVHELLLQLGTSVAGWEDALAASLSVNLYLAYGQTGGFPAHWDDHDVIVLQVYGEKRWRVWPPTGRPPFRGERPLATDAPGPSPIWCDTLKSGAVLYLPRGYWHEATPVGSCSVHLTCGIHAPTLLDYCIHGIRTAPNAPSLRANADSAGARETIQALLQLSEELRTDANMTSFRRSWRAKHRSPLPVSLSPQLVERTESAASDISLLVSDASRLRLDPSSDVTSALIDGQRWTLSPATTTVLRRALSEGGAPLNESLSAFTSEEARHARLTIEALTTLGIVRKARSGDVSAASSRR